MEASAGRLWLEERCESVALGHRFVAMQCNMAWAVQWYCQGVGCAVAAMSQGVSGQCCQLSSALDGRFVCG